MTVTAALARGRSARLMLMRDTVTITRITGQTFSPTTGRYLDTTATVYTGPADVKPRDVQASDVQAGEREQVLLAFDVALPWSAGAVIQVADRLTVTASDDSTLVDRMLTITAVGHGGRRTAHHLTAEDRS